MNYNSYWDLSTIPDDLFASERARRIARLRTTYTGGIFWKKHNPKTSRCRCQKCMDKREQEYKQEWAGKGDAQ